MEILRLKVTLEGCYALDGAPRAVRMLPFSGTCGGPLFEGRILPGGVDTQIDIAPGQGTLSARYMLEGVDHAGTACRIFIENCAVMREGGEVTHPRIMTDSAALKWLETASLTSRIETVDGHLEVIFSVEDSPNRRFVELERAGLKLRGVLERPGEGPCPLVLMMHGFGGCMDADSGLYQDISDCLTAAGLATLRFDFAGHGCSEGNFTAMTPYNQVEDAATFLQFARGLDFVTDIYALGHSQGGVMAGLTAGYYHDVIKKLVMLAPAASLKTDAQMGRCMRATYDPQHIPDSVDVDGRHHVGGLFFRMAQTLPIYEVTRQFGGPTLVVFGQKDVVVALEAAKRYLDGAAQGELALYEELDHGLAGADHEAMMARITAFLRG